jgi:hypothetical protein
MTAENPANAIPRPAERAVGFDGFEKVVRAGGLETAAGVRSAQSLQHRIEEPLVEADDQADDRFHRSSKGKEVPSAKGISAKEEEEVPSSKGRQNPSR